MPLSGDPPIKSEIAPQVNAHLKEADVRLTDFQWSSSGRELYFERFSRSVKNLWKVEVEPRSLRWTSGPERLTTGTGLDADLALSRNGKRLAFTSRIERTRLWSIPFDPAAGKAVGEPFRVTAFESPGQMILPEVGIMEMALAAGRLILPIMEVSGGIWILENVAP